jgi:hypothetical protein
MAVRYHDLADLITNTFCALLGITTVRPAFYSQFAASKYKWQNHQCEDTLLLLMKLLKAENQGSAEFSVIRQIHLWTSIKHEPEATRKAKLSPVGPVTREEVEYQETYLIQRLRPQKCTECGSGHWLGKAKCKECPTPSEHHGNWIST